MKIALFGATGRTGQIVLRRALEQDYHVNAYTRKPLSTSHENLQVFVGELSNEEQIRLAIQGVDAVICVLGGFHQEDVMPQAHQRILKIMQEEGVSRFITVLSAAAISHEKDKGSSTTLMFTNLASKFRHKKYTAGSKKVAQAIVNSSAKYTIARAVWPVDGPYTGKVNVGYGMPMGEKNMHPIKVKLSREDIAQFLLDQVQSRRFICDMPIIGGF